MLYRPKRNIKLIVCVSENDAIGKNNELLFHLKDDMKNFKKLTTQMKYTVDGNVVIMGYNTYKSLNKPEGLKNRVNIVLTRNEDKKNELEKYENIKVFNSLEEVMNSYYTFGKNVYIIGGASVYKEALDKDYVDEICLTRVMKTVKDADTFFPRLDYSKKWQVDDVDSYNEGHIKYDICHISKRNV